MSRIEDGGAVEAGLEKLAGRAKSWSLGTNRARVTVPLGEIRAALGEITRLRAENAGMWEALAKTETRFLHCAEMIEASFSCSGTLRAERTIKAKHYALEARAALSKASQAEGQTR